jgi:hypothetical protein
LTKIVDDRGAEKADAEDWLTYNKTPRTDRNPKPKSGQPKDKPRTK